MGYDLTRFQSPVDEELICPICSGVLQDPVQVSHTWLCFINLYFINGSLQLYFFFFFFRHQNASTLFVEFV